MRMLISSALAGAVMAGFAASVSAQVVTDPTLIRSCLCEQDSVTALRDTVQERQQNYDQSQKALASLVNQAATRRAQINVYNDGEVQAYKQLLAQRDAAQTAFAGATTDSYEAAVERYNAAVANYNSRCAGRSYDQTVVTQVRLTQSCPKP